MRHQPLVSFQSESLDFKLKNQERTSLWIATTIKQEGKKLGEVSYIFCSDDFLFDLNVKHLGHNTYTDIITFNYCDNDVISGDIFISVDRVKDNAKTYKTSFNSELNRVMIHGVLHLLEYNDKTNEEQEEMTSKEDFYLSLLNDLN